VLLVLGLGATVAAAATPAQQAGMPGMAGTSHWSQVAGGGFRGDGVTRTYYIGADEVVWNYAPAGFNRITGKPFDDVASTYVKSGPGRIGSRYLKCLYRGYTDATFRHLQPRPSAEAYLGLLGPVIRAQVGDTIKVVFRNGCRFPPASTRTACSTARTARAHPTAMAPRARARPTTPYRRVAATPTSGRCPGGLARGPGTAAR